MSAATEFPPVVCIPERARTRRVPLTVLPGPRTQGPQALLERPASPRRARPAPAPAMPVALANPRRRPVTEIEPEWSGTTLHRRVDLVADDASHPAAEVAARGTHVTTRGTWVLHLAALVAATVVVLAAWLSLRAHDGGAGSSSAAPATVTVHSGDTLWSVATVVAPDRDPRDEVDDLVRLNHLAGVAVTPGQVLRTR